MYSGSMQTREILFPNASIMTDSLLYKEKARLLLPEPYTQNLFLVQSDLYQTRFFLASESRRNLERMESFFFRLYDTMFEDSELPHMESASSMVLRNSLLNIRKKEFFHPAFVRNLFDYSSIERNATIRYSVSIRSGKHLLRNTERFNFTITVAFSPDDVRKRFTDLLGSELKAMKRQAGFRMKKSTRAKMSDNLLTNPFNLINFVRIPSERDHLV